jgi:hypothetical protein
MNDNDELLTYALRGYEHRRGQINEAIASLQERIRAAQNDGSPAAGIVAVGDAPADLRKPNGRAPRKSRRLSATGRAAIAAAARKRWAAFHKAQRAAKPRRGNPS